MKNPSDNYFQRCVEVCREAEELVGKRAWSLLSRYGRLVDGPHTGNYVSGVPFVVQLELVHQLTRGETVSVRLMHRHRSGQNESSSLRWSQERGVVMVFRDRTEVA